MDRRTFLIGLPLALAACRDEDMSAVVDGTGKLYIIGGNIPLLNQFDYYISTTGNDANDGLTPQTAWSITAINNNQGTYTGKRVGLMPGSYNLYAALNALGAGYSDNPYLQIVPGTASLPTVIGSVMPRAAILEGHQTPGQTGAGYPSGAAVTNAIIGQASTQFSQGQAGQGNVIIDALTVTGAFGSGIEVHGNFAAGTEGGALGVIVRNCLIYDCMGQAGDNVGAIKLRNTSGAVIQNNKCHDMGLLVGGVPTANGNASGIDTFNTFGTIYQYNTIDNCGSGIHEKDDHQGNSITRYNLVQCNGALATTFGCLIDYAGLAAGETNQYYGNILICNFAGASWFNNGSGASINPNRGSHIFYNNTLYATSGQTGGNLNLQPGGNGFSPTATWTHYNNLYLCAATGPDAAWTKWTWSAGNPSPLALSNYNYFTTQGQLAFVIEEDPTTLAQTNRSTLALWTGDSGADAQSVAGSVAISSIVNNANVNEDATGFQLKGGSPAINFGRVGGTSGGAQIDAGAWGLQPTQIGCNF